MKVYQDKVIKIMVYFESNIFALEPDNYGIYTIISSWLAGGGTDWQWEVASMLDGSLNVLSGLAEPFWLDI